MAPNLEEELFKRRSARDHARSYRQMKELFKEKIHPEITSLAIATDGVFLTDHGPRHIEQVIDRASRLVSQSASSLNDYELFLLLFAIHLHDIGNALGRIDHEKNADEILKLLYGPLGIDQLDAFLAEQIARVHGGKVEGDRDTIRYIDDKTTWRNQPVRPQFLAAILRLADEMAEDRHRANPIGVQLDRIKKPSQAHHIYAYGLHSFDPDAKSFTVDIKAAYPRAWFQKPLGKGDGEVMLLEEIYERTLKTYHEALYCSRYMRGAMHFSRVRVTVDVLDDQYRTRLKQIIYVIEERGYVTKDNIFELCPELDNYQRQGRLTSAALNKLLDELVSAE